jgi:hypothetical protein
VLVPGDEAHDHDCESQGKGADDPGVHWSFSGSLKSEAILAAPAGMRREVLRMSSMPA